MERSSGDLKADPEEMRNVAADPAYAQIKADLEVTLAEYQQRYDDEPYRGPSTPRPEWGSYDHEMFGRLQAYVASTRSAS
ncbi:hypothetical protein [Microbacterium foliorum]|uniref:hypothetical protein n=1 Tax=Microbacterium foliorum TaxID=104336 RepID=UPI0028D71179|nr:hypothetical protein [Microbacterium foliorum]